MIITNPTHRLQDQGNRQGARRSDWRKRAVGAPRSMLLEIDEEIPVEHYHAVAEIIGSVMGLRRNFAGRRS